MKTGVKHRKIFYVPGMVSLLFIPLLFFCYFYLNNTFRKEGCLDIGLPDKDFYASINKNYTFIHNRNFNEFFFNGSLETDKKGLIKFQKVLKEQNRVKDTINGIKIHFGKHMSYEVYIRVLDILNIENTPMYLPYQDHMIIVNGAPSDLKKERIRLENESRKKGLTVLSEPPCGNPAMEAAQREIEIENRLQTEKEYSRKSYFYNHSYLFIGYLCLGLLNIFMLIKFNKNRIYNQKSYI